ncbi:uncharacterized protein LOC130502240 [Raphanus sativus]|uniref:Uncharacterized protein LOC130502240 n=1 Tax=Raphanus sativus TaxID=3726 RepID=A0A9W3CN13_RAPSA|nr:uncharacterized protein LOC130502240 [Raphanus sativus]
MDSRPSFTNPTGTLLAPTSSEDIRLFFTTGVLHRQQNETHVRLIPKVTAARRVAEYRPISLCNTHYKIIAKILTRRLKPLLPQLISRSQSAFVAGRAIGDNVLITHETLHFLRTSEVKKYCSMAVKTDMSKAYDRIEWDFLRAVLEQLGFAQIWVDWVMACVETVLSSMCEKAQNNGSLPGVRVSRGSHAITHLLFADDTMFFCKSSASSVATLLGILRTYESLSGQCINFSTSSITFSAKTPMEVKTRVKDTLNIETEGGLEITQLDYAFSVESRKQVLLKAVLVAMPCYTMSCFKIPLSLCKQIQSLLTRFWWDSNLDKKKICWVSWDSLTQPKYAGGLGFRDVEMFNDALLAKIGWRLITNPDSLLGQVLLGKYAKYSSFMDVQLTGSASHGWRSILAGREILCKGLSWVIDSGERVRVWKDPWLSCGIPTTPIGPPNSHNENLLVSDLLCPVSNEWDFDRIRQHIPQYEDDIMHIITSHASSDDRLVWLFEKTGVYSTKSGYGVGIKDQAVLPPTLTLYN